MCFFVHARDLYDLVWGEERKNRCGWPNAEVVEDCLPRLRCHAPDQIRIRLLDVVDTVRVDAIVSPKDALKPLHEVELAQVGLRSIRVINFWLQNETHEKS